MTTEELNKVMVTYLNADDFEAFKSVLTKLDSDGSQRIDYSEFLNLTTNIKNLSNEENLRITFNSLDLDSNGKISIKEFKSAFEASG